MLKIGKVSINSPYFLAPMAGVSEMPFRVLAMQMGAGLATTELISAKGLFHRNRRTEQYLTYDKEKEVPYSLQLFGGEPEVMAYAAEKAAQIGAQIIDINMGCPVKKVTQTGAGSALLCDRHRASELLKQMRLAVGDDVPITAKIRSGWDADHINCVEMAKALEDAGCAAIALHARTRAQGYSGKADWSLIKALKQAVSIPVIGNGDVVSVEDAQRMQAETGCDAVMIGRGALGNPWLFSALRDNQPAVVAPVDRIPVILKHLREHVAFHTSLDSAGETRAIRSFRSHLVWYSHGIYGASTFREAVMQLDGMNAIEDAVSAFFGSHQVDKSQQMAIEDAEGIDYRQAFG